MAVGERPGRSERSERGGERRERPGDGLGHGGGQKDGPDSSAIRQRTQRGGQKDRCEPAAGEDEANPGREIGSGEFELSLEESGGF